MSTPENPSAPNPPAPGPKKTRKPRGPLDTATLEQLNKGEEIILAVKSQMASDPAFAGKLAPHFLDAGNTIAITAASVATLSQQGAAARGTAAAATAGTASHGDVTDR